MDMMLLGETVAVEVGASGNYYGFWMPAGGNEGVAAVETFLVTDAAAFEVHLDTKSSDAVDPGSSIGSVAINSTSPQLYKFDVTAAKDLVRYRVELFATENGAIAHLQFAQPLWSPN